VLYRAVIVAAVIADGIEWARRDTNLACSQRNQNVMHFARLLSIAPEK
jgi:hypothetical protein